jgi:hypothetical protein
MKHVQESYARDLHGEFLKAFGAAAPEIAVSIKGSVALRSRGAVGLA